jgi:acyl-coenzyme A thioesterase PaaI-like protein
VSTQPQQVPTELTENADLLADSVRRLVEVMVRTQARPTDLLAAVDRATSLLDQDLREGPWVPDSRAPGPSPYNAVLGTGNPLAAPLVLVARTAEGVTGTVRFGSAYEGAPGLVHGGVLSMVLDQAFGEAGVAAGVPGMTVGLELRYRAPTPLNTDMMVTARVVESTDRKVLMEGSISTGGETTVTATATFFRLTEEHAKRLFPHVVRG